MKYCSWKIETKMKNRKIVVLILVRPKTSKKSAMNSEGFHERTKTNEVLQGVHGQVLSKQREEVQVKVNTIRQQTAESKGGQANQRTSSSANGVKERADKRIHKQILRRKRRRSKEVTEERVTEEQLEVYES